MVRRMMDVGGGGRGNVSQYKPLNNNKKALEIICQYMVVKYENEQSQ